MNTTARPTPYSRPTCPICRAATGMPWCVSPAGDDTVTVSLRCTQCAYEWSATKTIEGMSPPEQCELGPIRFLKDRAQTDRRRRLY